MSYILEALRKADAERERGAVPDLHAQLLPPGATPTQSDVARAPLLPWLAVGVLLAVVAGGAWLMLGRDAPPGPVAMAPSPTPPVVAPAVPAPAASVAAAAASVASAAAPASVPAAAPAAAAKPAAARRAPPAKAVAQAAPRPPAATKPAKPAAPAEPPPARLPSLGELPGELRQQVPPLVIGGSVYSPQASVRMVIVNGQVFQEGSSLTPELKLEQIRPKAAVFSIRGQRFEMPF